jgi:DUF1365 family protein
VRSALYTGTVLHGRREPRRNRFRYRVSMTLIDLGELANLDRTLPHFGWNRRALTSYHDADHFDVRAFLAESGIDLGPDGRLLVLTNLRVLGYVFNPVSFWWCYASDGTLACVIAEVNNTFGERLPYLLPATGDGATFDTEKRLHVSPFLPMERRYRWRVTDPGARLAVSIDVSGADGHPFRAVLDLQRSPLGPSTLRRSLVRYPLMPAMVTLLIHWQAARLLAKRVPLFRKPPFVDGQGSVRP